MDIQQQKQSKEQILKQMILYLALIQKHPSEMPIEFIENVLKT